MNIKNKLIQLEKLESESGLEYYNELPEGYVKMLNIKEIFRIENDEEVLTVDNAIVRTNIELILFNPQTNKYEGMDIEAAQKLGNALGAKVTFVKFKWPGLIEDLLAGKFDIAMGGVSRSLARARVAAYTNSYMTIGTCPLVRKGEEGKYQDFASVDQPGVKIMLNQGGSNDRYFTPRIKKATILRHNKNEEIALKVKDGTADVWITDNVEALFWAEKLPGLVAANPTKTYTVKTKGYLIRQGDQVFLNWLNLWLEQMFLQGEIQKLQKKWLGIILK